MARPIERAIYRVLIALTFSLASISQATIPDGRVCTPPLAKIGTPAAPKKLKAGTEVQTAPPPADLLGGPLTLNKNAPAPAVRAPTGGKQVETFKGASGGVARFEILGPLGRGDTTIISRARDVDSGKEGGLRVENKNHDEDPEYKQYMRYFLEGCRQAEEIGVPVTEIIRAQPSQDWKENAPDWIFVKAYDIKLKLGDYLEKGAEALPKGVTHAQVVEAMKEFSEKSAKASPLGDIDLHKGNLVLIQEGDKVRFIVLDLAVGPRGSKIVKAGFLSSPMVHEDAFKVETEHQEIFESLAKAAWDSTIKGRRTLFPTEPAPLNQIQWQRPSPSARRPPIRTP